MSEAGLIPITGAVPTAMFNPETFTLANGMQVVVVTNRRAPVVAHYVWYRVGCADSPPGKSGLPHFLEHLMFKGTRRVPPGEFSKIVARNGGNDNAFTSQDYTAYFQMIAKDRLDLVMGLEADRMVDLDLSDEHVYPERDVILEERKQRVDNEPQALLGEAVNAAQFLHHPYRLPIIGWLHEIAAYTREDALAFYERWYSPANAILIAVGDVDADELRPLAERHYGALPGRAVGERRRVQEPPQHAGRRVELADPRVRQPSLVRSYLAPCQRGASPARTAALEVLLELLGEGTTSRLYRALVVEQGLAAAAAASYQPWSLDPTTARIYTTPRPGTALEPLEAALDAELAKLLDGGVGEDELERTKRRMIAESIYARDSLGGVARILGMALTTGLDLEAVEGWPQRIAAVDRAEVEAAAREVLVPAHAVTGRLLPAEAGADG